MKPVVSLLGRPLYSYADVDRLTGLAPGTGRRWLEGYTRNHVFYPPVLRSEPLGDNSVTWGEMVEARLLAEFRGSRVSLQRLRPAVERLREEFGDYPLARARPFLDVQGHELVRQIQDEVGLDPSLSIVVVRNDQLLLDIPAQRFRDSVVEYREGAAHVVRPDARVPQVVMAATRSFGQPAIKGVHTEVIVEEIRAGADRNELAGLYDITVQDVDAAIRFELIAAAPSA